MTKFIKFKDPYALDTIMETTNLILTCFNPNGDPAFKNEKYRVAIMNKIIGHSYEFDTAELRDAKFNEFERLIFNKSMKCSDIIKNLPDNGQ